MISSFSASVYRHLILELCIKNDKSKLLYLKKIENKQENIIKSNKGVKKKKCNSMLECLILMQWIWTKNLSWTFRSHLHEFNINWF